MKVELRVSLPDQWEDISYENPGGPATYSKSGSDGALQISIQGSYDPGQVSAPSESDLIRMCELVIRDQQAEILQRDSGECESGRFGRVICTTPDVGYLDIYTLTNGRDFILATYLAMQKPDPLELAQMETIVKTLRVSRHQ